MEAERARVSCSVPGSPPIPQQQQITSMLDFPLYVCLQDFIQSRSKYSPLLFTQPPKETTEQRPRSRGARQAGVPACCGPGLGTARCRSCWFSHSGAWRAAAPSGECPSSAGGCEPHPLCCHRRGRRRLNSPLTQSHGLPPLPEAPPAGLPSFYPTL